jgi:hypothetical protein
MRHSAGSLLALAAAAMLAGARSFAAIGESIADAPQRVLAVLNAGSTLAMVVTWRRKSPRCVG